MYILPGLFGNTQRNVFDKAASAASTREFAANGTYINSAVTRSYAANGVYIVEIV